jgi:AraC family transcriptional regulator, regulatory protein of adaptative response / DNA-3-methyladenine glycosylase II
MARRSLAMRYNRVMDLNHESYYRALTTRDVRFDGLFFVGVTTTRIYCRPVCSARTPRIERCRFFPGAAAAEQAGFRPCLRCRPEIAPGRSSVDAVSRVARAAAVRIEAGILNSGGSLEDLALEFGLSSRQLRRVMRQELGVSPIQLAQTHRLLLAKQLLTETRLPIIEVAFASGFESLRRFNALFQSHYRLTPSRFRRSLESLDVGEPLRLQLTYRPPIAWSRMLNFLSDRAIAGVECVAGDCYSRTVAIGPHRGWLSVSPSKSTNALSVEIAASLTPALAPILSKVRHLFDLSARPDVISLHLHEDARIGPAVDDCPGLRVPGAFDGFELAWRAILGQRISVRAATTLAKRLAAQFGEPIATPLAALDRLSPDPARVASVDPQELVRLGISRDRSLAIQAIGKAIAEGRLRLEPGTDPEAAIEQLKGFACIGEWTAQYIAMRALGWPDAFPHGDLGVLRGLGETSHAKLLKIAEGWRPWRSYAVMHVWNGLVTPTEVEP